MFDSLTDRLGEVFDRLRRHGALTEADVGAALREIRIAWGLPAERSGEAAACRCSGLGRGARPTAGCRASRLGLGG